MERGEVLKGRFCDVAEGYLRLAHGYFACVLLTAKGERFVSRGGKACCKENAIRLTVFE